jgi:hypothetical protein
MPISDIEPRNHIHAPEHEVNCEGHSYGRSSFGFVGAIWSAAMRSRWDLMPTLLRLVLVMSLEVLEVIASISVLLRILMQLLRA